MPRGGNLTAVCCRTQGWDFASTKFLSGVVLWGAMALLVVTSLNPIRRALFEVFMYLYGAAGCGVRARGGLPSHVRPCVA